MRTRYSYEDPFFVPEITSISPTDMVLDDVKLLNADGKINMREVKKYYTAAGFALEDEAETLPLKPLVLYPIYRNR